MAGWAGWRWVAQNDAAVQEIAESFKRRRTTFIDGLKERARREESGSGSRDTVTTKSGATKPKPRVKAKARAKKEQPAWHSARAR